MVAKVVDVEAHIRYLLKLLRQGIQSISQGHIQSISCNNQRNNSNSMTTSFDVLSEDTRPSSDVFASVFNSSSDSDNEESLVNWTISAETAFMSGIFWVLSALDLLLDMKRNYIKMNDKCDVGHTFDNDLLFYDKSFGRWCLSDVVFNGIHNFVNLCFDKRFGGFKPHPNHDPDIVSTLNALQIQTLLESMKPCSTDKTEDAREVIFTERKPRIICYILSLFENGAANENRFFSDIPLAYQDARNTMSSIASLYLVHSKKTTNQTPLNFSEYISNVLDVDKCVHFLLSCQNIDGGFGGCPGCESHAGFTFCCVASVVLLDEGYKLYGERSQMLARWLKQRYNSTDGGLNGRVGKPSDSCYCWWTLATDVIIQNYVMHECTDCVETQSVKSSFCFEDRSHMIDYILDCQVTYNSSNNEASSSQQPEGGLSRHSARQSFNSSLCPHNSENQLKIVADPFHTLFSLCGLALLVNDCQFDSQGSRHSHALQDIHSRDVETNPTAKLSPELADLYDGRIPYNCMPKVDCFFAMRHDVVRPKNYVL